MFPTIYYYNGLLCINITLLYEILEKFSKIPILTGLFRGGL